MSLLRFALLAVAFSVPAAVLAAPSAAVVESIGLPAWVVRDGKRLPLAAGQPLVPGEMVITGRGSRALLRLPDGSGVRLGEDTRFVVASAAASDGGNPLFRATLRVLTGAFRFTTGALAKGRMQRDVSIQMTTVTAGIRGTDLWGRSADDREFVVLIEGRIGVRRARDPEVVLDTPRSVFLVPRDASAASVGTITATELGEYAAQTEIASGSGAATIGGQWKVTAAESREQTATLATYDRLRDAGYPAVIEPRGRGEAALYRVRLVGLASRADALALAAQLTSRFGFENVRVSR